MTSHGWGISNFSCSLAPSGQRFYPQPLNSSSWDKVADFCSISGQRKQDAFQTSASRTIELWSYRAAAFPFTADTVGTRKAVGDMISKLSSHGVSRHGGHVYLCLPSSLPTHWATDCVCASMCLPGIVSEDSRRWGSGEHQLFFPPSGTAFSCLF